MIAGTLNSYLERQRTRVDQALQRVLPPADQYPTSIHQAMRYSVFAGGKRLRPILCVETGLLLGGEEESLVQVGSALELIHTYSLIHDDLPALDNDDLRRGKPACHRQFGEATAILAGDALLTLAYEVISSANGVRPALILGAIGELSRAIGTRAGMVAGQVVDLESTSTTVDASTLQYIHSAKTGSFMSAAVRIGAILAGSDGAGLERLSEYGEKIGLAFQIADDLLDVLGSAESMGKAVGKDGRQKKATYPAVHGVEESKRMARQLVGEACIPLEPFGPNEHAERLRDIAHFLIERNS